VSTGANLITDIEAGPDAPENAAREARMMLADDAEIGMTVKLRVEPGNGTRYDIVVGKLHPEGWLVALVNFGRAFVFPFDTPSMGFCHPSYAKEKFDLNYDGDAEIMGRFVTALRGAEWPARAP